MAVGGRVEKGGDYFRWQMGGEGSWKSVGAGGAGYRVGWMVVGCRLEGEWRAGGGRMRGAWSAGL
jgi:hypothetical protein